MAERMEASLAGTVEIGTEVRQRQGTLEMQAEELLELECRLCVLAWLLAFSVGLESGTGLGDCID